MRVLDPDVVLRADFGPRRRAEVVRGAAAVAGQANIYRRVAQVAEVKRALVNGTVGGVVILEGKPFAVMSFVVRGHRIVEIDVYNDPDRVARIAAPILDGSPETPPQTRLL